MEPTLRIKITIEVEEELKAAEKLLSIMPQQGYLDRATLRFYPADSIYTIEVLPLPPPIEFSGN